MNRFLFLIAALGLATASPQTADAAPLYFFEANSTVQNLPDFSLVFEDSDGDGMFSHDEYVASSFTEMFSTMEVVLYGEPLERLFYAWTFVYVPDIPGISRPFYNDFGEPNHRPFGYWNSPPEVTGDDWFLRYSWGTGIWAPQTAWTYSVTPLAVPLPAGGMILASALLALAAFRFRRPNTHER